MKIIEKTGVDKNVLTLKITGSIDTLTAPELESVVNSKCSDLAELILDFSEVDYISSAGLRCILLAFRLLEGHGKLHLVNVGQDVREIFEVTGFDSFLDIK